MGERLKEGEGVVNLVRVNENGLNCKVSDISTTSVTKW